MGFYGGLCFYMCVVVASVFLGVDSSFSFLLFCFVLCLGGKRVVVSFVCCCCYCGGMVFFILLLLYFFFVCLLLICIRVCA